MSRLISIALVAYGDWSRTTQMRHFVPTKGVGMRRLISRHFETVSINEFRTSKLCCNCQNELSHVKIDQEERKKKLFRCLVCDECERSESKTRVFVTRDLNSALNIRRLACDWISGQTRPVAFCRSATGLPTTATAEKDGQSVDFTARHGANLCESGLDPEGRRLRFSKV